MRINELEIGDRVKFRFGENIKNGCITYIDINTITILNDLRKDCGYGVYKNDVISKLELIIKEQEYKEIIIEHKYPYGSLDYCKQKFDQTIKVSDLKVNDIIRYYDEGIHISKIKSINYPNFITEFHRVNESNIIEKLVPKNVYRAEEYDVIKIDKTIKETEDTKEKPAPKSFKLNFRPKEVKWVGGSFNFQNIVVGDVSDDGYRCSEIEFPWVEWIKTGKDYTIEIKEKE